MNQENKAIDCNVRLSELEHEHYQLEDQIKKLAQEIKEIAWRSPERMRLLIAERTEKELQLKTVNAEADHLRQQKQLS